MSRRERHRLNVLYAPAYDFDMSSVIPDGVTVERRSGNAWGLDSGGAPAVVSAENVPSLTNYWTGSAWAPRGIQARQAQTAMLRDSGATTYWGADTGNAGLTFTKSTVTVNGLRCVRLRVNGTSSGSGTRRLFLESYSGTPLVGYLTDFIKGDLATLVGHFSASATLPAALTSFGLQMREYWTTGGVQQSPDSASLSFTPLPVGGPAKALPVKLPYRVRRNAELFDTLLPVLFFVVTAGQAVDFTIDFHVQLLKNAAVADGDDAPFPTNGTDKLTRASEELILAVKPGSYDALIEDRSTKVWRKADTTGRLTIVPPNGGQSVTRVRLYKRGAITRSQKRRMAPDALPTPLWIFKPTLANTTVDGNGGLISLTMGGGRSAGQSNAAKRPVRVVDGLQVYLDFQEGDFLDLVGVESNDLRTIIAVFRAPDIEVPHVDGSTIQCTLLGQEAVANRQQLAFGGPTVPGAAVYANAFWTLHNQNATSLDADAVSQTVANLDVWTTVAHTRANLGLYQPFDIYQPDGKMRLLNASNQFERYILFTAGNFAEIGRRSDPALSAENPAHFVGQLAALIYYSPPLTEAQRARAVTEEWSAGLSVTPQLRVESLWAGEVTNNAARMSANVTGAAVGQRARFIISTNEDLSSPVYVSDYATADDIFAEVSPAIFVFRAVVPPGTLSAVTQYFWNVEFENA